MKKIDKRTKKWKRMQAAQQQKTTPLSPRPVLVAVVDALAGVNRPVMFPFDTKAEAKAFQEGVLLMGGKASMFGGTPVTDDKS